MIDGQTLLLILVAGMLLFGANKLPELARSLGKATGEFKKAQLETAEQVRILETTPRVETETTPANNTSKDISQNVMKLATDLGIKTEGKDENMILAEIKALAKSKSV